MSFSIQKMFFAFAVTALMILPVSCTSVEDTGGGAIPGLKPLPAQARPRIIVKPFKLSNQVSNYGYRGIRNLQKHLATRLQTELVSTGRFSVLSRGEGLKMAMDEQDYGATDRVDQSTKAKMGKIQGGQIAIIPKIIDMKRTKAAAGGGFFTRGGGGGVAVKSAYVEVSVQAVDIQTSQILFQAQAKGTARSVGVVGGFKFSHHGRDYYMAGGGFYETSLGEAVQEVLRHLTKKLARAAGGQIPSPQYQNTGNSGNSGQSK